MKRWVTFYGGPKSGVREEVHVPTHARIAVVRPTGVTVAGLPLQELHEYEVIGDNALYVDDDNDPEITPT